MVSCGSRTTRYDLTSCVPITVATASVVTHSLIELAASLIYPEDTVCFDVPGSATVVSVGGSMAGVPGHGRSLVCSL